MKVFISYHRADTKAREHIEDLLKDNDIPFYAVPKDVNFDGENHQYIKDTILQGMIDCDVLLCIVGKDTYTRPHVDWELHEALKGNVNNRRGILSVMLENRRDSKNNIDYATFPNRLEDNEDYIAIEQYASLQDRLKDALDEALDNSRNRYIQVNNRRPPMPLRQGKYFDIAYKRRMIIVTFLQVVVFSIQVFCTNLIPPSGNRFYFPCFFLIVFRVWGSIPKVSVIVGITCFFVN